MASKEKAQELFRREEMLKKLKGEEPVSQWAVQLQRSSRKGRFAELKKKGI